MVESIPNRPLDPPTVYSMFQPQSYTLPTARICINKVFLNALCDTGSAINLLSGADVNCLENFKTENCNIPIMTVTGERVHLNKKVFLKFVFDSVQCQAEFYVVEGKLAEEFNVILGMPFLKEYRASINCDTNAVALKVPAAGQSKQSLETPSNTSSGSNTCLATNSVNISNSVYSVNSNNNCINNACVENNSVNVKYVNKVRENSKSSNANSPPENFACREVHDSVNSENGNYSSENMVVQDPQLSNMGRDVEIIIQTESDKEVESVAQNFCMQTISGGSSEGNNTENSSSIQSVDNILSAASQVTQGNLAEDTTEICNIDESEDVVSIEDEVPEGEKESNEVSSSDRTYKNKSLSFAVLCSKISIPPQSKMLAQVKSYKENFIKENDIVMLEPLAKNLNQGLLTSRAICTKEHGLYISFANFSDNSIHLNKGTFVAKIQKCVDKSNVPVIENNLTCNVNLAPPIGDFDHADLTWSSEINLDHLEPPLKLKMQNFLDKNKDVFAASVLDLPGCDTIPHEINLTSNKPVKGKAYRVPYKLRQEMEDQLNTLLQADIISPSMSEFASPVILVRKSDGSYRLAVDYRRLNKNLVKDAYPIPNITDSVDALSGAKFFSTLDLTSGFFQQVIRPEDRHKTAIITHKGLFEWTRNCFGLSNSGNSFQRLMNAIFGDLGNLGILVYIDDIVIASCDVNSHFEKLNMVFDRLRLHKLKLKPSKCTFLSNKIQYLGFEICSGQVSPINKNIAVIENFKPPTTRKAVRSFIGTLSFYRRFIPDFTKRAKNLINLTKETGKFLWNEDAQKEFEDLKMALISKPCLALPDFEREFHLYSDASGEALGAVLSQLDENNMLHPVAFASRKLKDAETRYSTTERELLALVWATAHFKCYIANTHFFIYTDHAPLTFMLKIHDPTSRMAKWICTLSDFNFTIKFVKGKCNSVADFLSRYVNNDNPNDTVNCNFCIQVEKEVTFMPHSNLLEKIGELQKSDKKCCDIARKLDQGVEIAPKYMKFFFRDDILVCEDTRESAILNKSVKLVVPKELVTQVFALTHESLAACHQAFQKTIDRIREHFYWPGMSADVKHLVESCISCQQKRAYRANQLAPLQRMPTPQFPMNKVHLDLIGPLPQTFSGNKYIVAYIDSFTKWPEAYAVSSTTSDVIADTLADFISRYGAPCFITTDNAKNLISDAIEHVYKMFGIKHIKTSTYHPAGNSQVERQNRTLKNALCHIVNQNQSDWDTKLKFALLAMRSAVHSSTKLSPAAVMYGRNMNLPYNLFSQPPSFNYNDAPSFCELLIPALQKVYTEVHSNLIKVSEQQEKYREKTAVDKNFKIGDLVWLFTPTVAPGNTKKLSKQNNGPFTIIEKLNEVNFKIALVANPKNCQVVHVDRLSSFKDRLPIWSSEPKQTIGLGSTENVTIDSPQQPCDSPPVRRCKRNRFIPWAPYDNNRAPAVVNVNNNVTPVTPELEETDSDATEIITPSPPPPVSPEVAAAEDSKREISATADSNEMCVNKNLATTESSEMRVEKNSATAESSSAAAHSDSRRSRSSIRPAAKSNRSSRSVSISRTDYSLRDRSDRPSYKY